MRINPWVPSTHRLDSPALPASRLSALILACALAWPSIIRAQGTDLEGDARKAKTEIAKVKKEIQRADSDLRRADSLLKDETARAAQAEERQARDRERREKENAAFQNRLAETQGRIDAERSSVARQQNAMDEVKARERRLASLLAQYCDSLIVRVEAGLPWDKEPRLDRIRALKRDLQAGSAPVEEGLSRLSALLKQEVKEGDEIAAFNKPITRKNGESMSAQVMRIGNQWLAYMDPEGARFGILERSGKGWEWREDLSFSEKNRLREAFEVKASKRPPQLVALDLGISPNSSGAPSSSPAPAAPSIPVAPAAPASHAPKGAGQ